MNRRVLPVMQAALVLAVLGVDPPRREPEESAPPRPPNAPPEEPRVFVVDAADLRREALREEALLRGHVRPLRDVPLVPGPRIDPRTGRGFGGEALAFPPADSCAARSTILAPRPVRPTPGPNDCPDNCGTACRFHGRRNAKLQRRAARAEHAALVLVWVCDTCGPVARSVLRREGDVASCPRTGCYGFADVARVAPAVAGPLPMAPPMWTGSPF